MSRNARPHYRPGLGWILGFAFEDTLARPVRLAQEFTFVRCHGSPRASSPHGLTAPAMPPLDAIRCVQLPPARGCYQPAPQRTLTSNPVPMPGTPSLRRPGMTNSGSSEYDRLHGNALLVATKSYPRFRVVSPVCRYAVDQELAEYEEFCTFRLK